MAEQREKEIRAQQLFNDMKTAEAVKDMDPDTYNKARVEYNRATKGESWMKEEEDRLLKEADANIQGWLQTYNSLQALRDSHRSNLDAVRNADVAQISYREDVSFAVNELKRLIGKDEDARTLADRETALRHGVFAAPSWLIYVFDALLIFVMLYVAFLLYAYLERIQIATNVGYALKGVSTAQKSYYDAVQRQLA